MTDFTKSKVGQVTENESPYIAVSHFTSDDRQSKVGRVTENEQRPLILNSIVAALLFYNK